MKTLTIPGSSFTAEYDESSDRAMLRSRSSSRRANNEELALIKMVLAEQIDWVSGSIDDLDRSVSDLG